VGVIDLIKQQRSHIVENLALALSPKLPFSLHVFSMRSPSVL
jgi:hypothetical protein